MPYQNLNSEIMLALAIWFLPIGIFTIMLLLAMAEIISENRKKSGSKRWDNLVRIAVNIFQRKK